MKKIICSKEYDTEKSTLVKKLTRGEFGDPDGYEQSLYLTEDGKYFFYTNGGESSQYPKEDIKRASKSTAEKWLAENT